MSCNVVIGAHEDLILLQKLAPVRATSDVIRMHEQGCAGRDHQTWWNLQLESPPFSGYEVTLDAAFLHNVRVVMGVV